MKKRPNHDLEKSVKSKRENGFTLFELVSYILVVSITASVAYNRFGSFPGAAERANFLAVMTQLKSGVTLQMMNGIARGGWAELGHLEGSNPMDLMLETPSNYVGEMSAYDVEAMPARIWYYNTSSKELVYIANDSTDLYRVVDGQRIPTDTVGFKITMQYGDEARSNWQGLVLEPTAPYVWESIDLRIPGVAEQ